MTTNKLGYFDYLSAFYQRNSYLPQVSKSECFTQRVRVNLKFFAEQASLFTQPLDSKNVMEKNADLERKGFTVLGSKVFSSQEGEEKELPFYSVLEHPSLPGWVIKHAAVSPGGSMPMEGPESFSQEVSTFTGHSSLLRIARRDQLAQASQKLGFTHFVFPEKKIAMLTASDGTKAPVILAQKFDVLSANDTRAVIASLSVQYQKQLANQFAQLILQTGFADANFTNIRLTKDGQRFVFLDTEATRAVILSQGLCTRLFGWQSSIEKSARIGLANLIRSSSVSGLESFSTELKEQYTLADRYQFSYIKGFTHLAILGLEYAFLPQYKVAALAVTTLFPFILSGVKLTIDRTLNYQIANKENTTFYESWLLYLQEGVRSKASAFPTS